MVDLLQFWGMVQWRLSREAACTFTVRWVPYVSDIVVKGTPIGDQGNPTIRVGLEIEFIDLKNAFALIPGFVFSASCFTPPISRPVGRSAWLYSVD